VTAPGQGSLAFDRFGEGEPLVLIHGLGSRRGAWMPAAEIVAREREVIAIDLPGFGDSVADGSASVEDFTGRVQAFFAEQGLERPHVGGNSLGGGIGFELARRRAARSLTAFSPIGLWSSGERRRGSAAFRLAHALGERAPERMPARLRANLARPTMFVFAYGHPWRVPDEEILDAAESGQEAPGFELALPAINTYDLQRPEELREVPTTIAWGSRDVLIPAWSNPRRARRALPWARHVSLRGCGHVPFFDDPEACARVLLQGSVSG
jgi:pimeloyl-ACP methyl ester carboxylesterase